MNLNEAFMSLDLAPCATIDQVNKTYKRLIAEWHPDKYQTDENMKPFAEKRTREINAARDWLVAHFKGVKKINGQQAETTYFSVNYGQVPTFISEYCNYNSSESTERSICIWPIGIGALRTTYALFQSRILKALCPSLGFPR